MWIADKEIMQINDFDDNIRPQSLQGKVPLLLMIVASFLIHALALGVFCTTTVNPFARKAEMQEPAVIQVTLSSVVASSITRAKPIPRPLSPRGTINDEKNKKQTEFASESKQTERATPKETKQESPPSVKTDKMSPGPLAVSAVQLTSWPGKSKEGGEPAPGKQAPANYSGSDHFSATDEGIPLIKPHYVLTPSPVYPMAARRLGHEGVVLLSVEVLANGRAGRVWVKKSSGSKLLDQSALTAVSDWQFEPARQKQKTQAMTVDIPIRFSLNSYR